MRSALKGIAATALVAAGILKTTAPAGAQEITPVDIPASFGIGTMGGTIQSWVDNNQQDLIRQHAWTIWAGLNAPSGTVYNGANLPVWETWLGTEEVFPNTVPQPNPTVQLAGPRRSFINPNQFTHLAKMAGKVGVTPSPADTQVVSFNKFSPSAATFISTPQTIPGLSGTYSINTGSGLNALNAAWSANTPVSERSINDFPVDGIELKPVMGVVKGTGITPLPLWQGVGSSATTNPTNPTPDTWKTCIAVDPKGTGGVQPVTAVLSTAQIAVVQAAAVAAGLKCVVSLYAPLSMLYNFQMSAAEAEAMTAAQGNKASVGDYAVLLAMHVSTKEIPFWTWQTFYWQPGADTPNKFPGTKSDVPASLPAPFNNYAMCAAYSQSVTVNNQTTMQVCFNPYLETSPNIPAGITSNCMSCHGLAGVGTGPTYPPSYTAPINFFGNTTYFNNASTRTDFSWAVANAP